MNKSIVQIVSDYLGYTEKEAEDISKKAPKTYRRYTIPKKKGGVRVISHPSKLTKSLQYALIVTILSDLKIHDCAVAYRRGKKSPLLENAKIHSAFPYSVRVDFEDFFPSITSSDLFKVMERVKKFEKLTRGEKEFLKNSLFIRGDSLAIGAPSSPIISNIVMYSTDEEINSLAKSISNKSAYSRYADDLVFSTDEKGKCNTFYDQVKLILNKNTSPKLTVNHSKTIFTSRGTRRVVTGLYICPNGEISIGRKNKRYIKKLLFEFDKTKIRSEELKYLSGFLSYILDVEPHYYHKLAMKYGADLLERARKKVIT